MRHLTQVLLLHHKSDRQVHAPVAPHNALFASKQNSDAQHGVPEAAQLWPMLMHIALWQVPTPVPGLMLHVLPEQQSDGATHAPPVGWQT